MASEKETEKLTLSDRIFGVGGIVCVLGLLAWGLVTTDFFFTQDGCPLPIDLVADSTCVFSSLSGLVAGIVFAGIVIVALGLTALLIRFLSGLFSK